MKNTFGDNISVTIFGESHGNSVGAVIDGLAPGIPVNTDFIARQLDLRRPTGAISTARCEGDEFVIESGVFEGKTTGTPLCIRIPNKSQMSRDYEATRALARPGHADYSAYMKYHGYEDYRGGGHFSGRVTAAIVAAGAVIIDALKKKNIYIGTHLKECGGVSDRPFGDYAADIENLSDKIFPALDDARSELMQKAILKAKDELDSVGGILETVITGVPAGVGEPWFDSVESKLAHAMFSVGGVKGIEFGSGFATVDMKGSEANDAFRADGGKVYTETNNNGGINGGITNGMPIVFSCAVKPTPSIYKEQKTVDIFKGENANIAIEGRHDPCIAHRARVVIDSLCALVIADLLTGRFGTDYLAN